jgi:hypothetical protein
MEQYLKVLASYNFKRHRLSPALSDFLRSKASCLSVPSGEIIQEPGMLRHQLLFIEKGVVQYYYMEDGISITSRFRCENQFIPSLEEGAYLFRSSDPVGAQVLSPVSMWCWAEADINEALRRHPELQHPFSAIFSLELCTKVEDKDMLRYSLEQQFEILWQRSPSIFTQAPLHYAAAFLGMKEARLAKLVDKHKSIKNGTIPESTMVL